MLDAPMSYLHVNSRTCRDLLNSRVTQFDPQELKQQLADAQTEAAEKARYQEAAVAAAARERTASVCNLSGCRRNQVPTISMWLC